MTKSLLISSGILINVGLVMGALNFEKNWGPLIQGVKVSIAPLISNIDANHEIKMTPAPDKSPQNTSGSNSSSNNANAKLNKPEIVISISVKNTSKVPVSILTYTSALIPQGFDIIKIDSVKNTVDITKDISSLQTQLVSIPAGMTVHFTEILSDEQIKKIGMDGIAVTIPISQGNKADPTTPIPKLISNFVQLPLTDFQHYLDKYASQQNGN